MSGGESDGLLIPITENEDGELRVSSLTIAAQCEVEHRSVVSLLDDHAERMDRRFGKVRFEIAPSAAGQKRRVVSLNEPQASFLITLLRNTEPVLDFKAALVAAFYELRRERFAAQLAAPEVPALPDIPYAIPYRYACEHWLSHDWTLARKQKFVRECFALAAESRAEPHTDGENGAVKLPRWLLETHLQAMSRKRREGFQRDAAGMLSFMAAAPRDVWFPLAELWEIAKAAGCFPDLYEDRRAWEKGLGARVGLRLKDWLGQTRILPGGGSVHLAVKGDQRHKRYRVETEAPSC